MPYRIEIPGVAQYEFDDDVSHEDALNLIPQEHFDIYQQNRVQEQENKVSRDDRLATESPVLSTKEQAGVALEDLMRPRIELPKEDIAQAASIAAKSNPITAMLPEGVVKGATDIGTGLAESLTSPFGMATLPYMATKALKPLWAYFGGKMVEEGSKELGEASVTRDPRTATRGAGSVGLGGVMAGHHAANPVLSELLAKEKLRPVFPPSRRPPPMFEEKPPIIKKVEAPSQTPIPKEVKETLPLSSKAVEETGGVPTGSIEEMGFRPDIVSRVGREAPADYTGEPMGKVVGAEELKPADAVPPKAPEVLAVPPAAPAEPAPVPEVKPAATVEFRVVLADKIHGTESQGWIIERKIKGVRGFGGSEVGWERALSGNFYDKTLAEARAAELEGQFESRQTTPTPAASPAPATPAPQAGSAAQGEVKPAAEPVAGVGKAASGPRPEPPTETTAFDIDAAKTEADRLDEATSAEWNKYQKAEQEYKSSYKKSYDDSDPKTARAKRKMEKLKAAWDAANELESDARRKQFALEERTQWDKADPFNQWVWQQKKAWREMPEGPARDKFKQSILSAIDAEWLLRAKELLGERAGSAVNRVSTLTESVLAYPLEPRNDIGGLAKLVKRLEDQDTARVEAEKKFDEWGLKGMDRPRIRENASVEEVSEALKRGEAAGIRLESERKRIASESEAKVKEEQAAEITKARELQAKGKLHWVTFGNKEGGSYWKAVEGKPVKVPAAPNHEFFVWKSGVGQWSVTESKTGKLINTGSTQGEAIARSSARITEVGKQKFDDAITYNVEFNSKNMPPKPSLEADPTPGKTAQETAAEKAKADAEKFEREQRQALEEEQAGGEEFAGPGGTTPSDVGGGAQLEQLRQSLEGLKPADAPLGAAVKESFNLGAKLASAKDAIQTGLVGLKSAGAWLKSKLIGIPKVGQWEKDLGELLYAKQRSYANVKSWVKDALKQVPNQLRRNAIGVFIDAGGDVALLEKGASETKGATQAAYRQALTLTPEEKILAQNISNYFEGRLKEAQEAGILQDGIENYIHRIYPKESEWKRRVLSEIRTGFLNTATPALAKKRVFKYDFEASKAGNRPIHDFVARIAAYDQELNHAIANRAFVKQQMQRTMPDGRPAIDVGGIGTPIPRGETPREATLIKPQFKIKDTEKPENNRGDYLAYNHPAFRKWKWLGEDEGGKPIFVQGDVLVHPEFIGKIRTLLDRSKVRINPIGNAALAASTVVKQTMLDLSGFHAVQVTVHGWEHRTFKIIDRIDFDSPDQARLIKSGVTAAPMGEYQMWSEGSGSASLTKHIPGLGPVLHSWNQFLFEDWIPRLKMSMALHALDRNKSRFPKMSQDQVYRLTADQANAAFGELNYELIGRSKTTQDVFRLAMLAPDFFEARAKFVGQAATQFGTEQRVALGLGALALYLTARTANKMLDDQYHFEPENAFSVVYKGRAYSLRTVQGDLIHALTNRAKFMYSRLNPVFGRTAMEALTWRDYFGRTRTEWEQFKDFAAQIVPISMRGAFAGSEQKVFESFLNAFGITTRRWMAVNSIYKSAREFRKEHGPEEPGEFIYNPNKDIYRPIKNALSYGDLETARTEVKKLLASEKITRAQLNRHFLNWSQSPFTGSKKLEAQFKKSLGSDALKDYDAANQERRAIYAKFRSIL